MVLARSAWRSRTLSRRLPATSAHLPSPCCTYDLVVWRGGVKDTKYRYLQEVMARNAGVSTEEITMTKCQRAKGPAPHQIHTVHGSYAHRAIQQEKTCSKRECKFFNGMNNALLLYVFPELCPAFFLDRSLWPHHLPPDLGELRGVAPVGGLLNRSELLANEYTLNSLYAKVRQYHLFPENWATTKAAPNQRLAGQNKF